MKQLLTLAVFAFCSITLRAADIVVDFAGGGSYTDIQSAINAAAPGDRILVFPGSYNGFTINNGSIQILSAIAGQRYQVSSDVRIGAITGPVHLSNAEFLANANFTSIADCTSPQTTRITDSKFFGPGVGFVDFRNHIVHVQNDTFDVYGSVYIRHGSITGCYFSGGGIAAAYTTSTAPDFTDTVRIIGNRWEAAGGYPIYCYNQHANVYVEGNFIKASYISNIFAFFLLYDNPATGNTIINNTIYCNNGAQYGPIFAIYNSPPSYNPGKTNIRNNVISITPAWTAGLKQIHTIYGSGAPAGMQISYNVFSDDVSSVLGPGYTDDGTNSFNSAVSVDPATGNLNSAVGVDAGDPNPAFYDLDKTRNDAGCFGGSYSQANFNQPDNGSRVLMLTAPRVVLGGNNVTIKGDGLAK